MDQPNKPINRREFISRTLKAGIAVAVTGVVGIGWHDTKGPQIQNANPASVTLPDYSIKSLSRKIAIVQGDDRTRTLTKALESLGGLETFIKPGDKVLLKVNAAFASPASLGATTHPDVIRQMIRLCFKAGASDVRVTDNPINDPTSCFKLSGIAEAVESEGGKLYYPKDSYFKPITIPGAGLIVNWPFLYEPVKGITKIIGIAPLKDHHRSGASMTMKNWYGLLGGRRNTFHQDIHNIIKELSMMIQPTLVVLDGTVSMMTNGPTGGSLSDLKPTNLMIVSNDQVAADTYGAMILGKGPGELTYLKKAQDAGSGTMDYNSLKPVIIL